MKTIIYNYDGIDEKRKLIKENDETIFTNNVTQEKIKTKVKKIVRIYRRRKSRL